MRGLGRSSKLDSVGQEAFDGEPAPFWKARIIRMRGGRVDHSIVDCSSLGRGAGGARKWTGAQIRGKCNSALGFSLAT